MCQVAFFWEGTLHGNLGVHVCLKDGFPKTYPVFKYTNMSYMDQEGPKCLQIYIYLLYINTLIYMDVMLMFCLNPSPQYSSVSKPLCLR